MLKFRNYIGVILVVLLAFNISACTSDKQLPAGVITMTKLKEQNKAPVEIVNASAIKTVGNTATNTNPTVTLEVKNISDKKITLVNWVEININSDEKLCENWMNESGYAEIEGIKPGESIEGSGFSSDPETSKVVIIVKDLVYESVENGYSISLKWTNDNFDAELQKAKDTYK